MGMNPFDLDWNKLWTTPCLIVSDKSDERPIIVNIVIKDNKILVSDDLVKKIVGEVRKELGCRIQVNTELI